MSKFLKGNYPLPGNPEEPAPEPKKAASSVEFERRALERLGGSIAFVMKKNAFVWNGDKPADVSEKSKR